MGITRSDVEGVIGFLAANPDGATDLEREALAAYQANPEAAIQRALAHTTPTATVETSVMFSPEQLRHAGARFLAAMCVPECPTCGRVVSSDKWIADEHHPKCPQHDPHF